MITNIFKIAIGISFFTLRIITEINDQAYQFMNYNYSRGFGEIKKGLFHMRYIVNEGSVEYNEIVYHYSLTPYFIGLLFIAWGVYSIIKEETK